MYVFKLFICSYFHIYIYIYTVYIHIGRAREREEKKRDREREEEGGRRGKRGDCKRVLLHLLKLFKPLFSPKP